MKGSGFLHVTPATLISKITVSGQSKTDSKKQNIIQMSFKFNKKKTTDQIKVVNKVTAPWATLLTIFFIVLKVLGVGAVANWSWWWVFSPLWLPIVAVIAIVVAIFVLGFIALFLFYWIQSIVKKRRLKRRLRKLEMDRLDLWSRKM
jgi:sterol desaturase/sphingolipid hydroxylase (fatty acid hydroxylase superfamily)